MTGQSDNESFNRRQIEYFVDQLCFQTKRNSRSTIINTEKSVARGATKARHHDIDMAESSGLLFAANRLLGELRLLPRQFPRAFAHPA